MVVPVVEASQQLTLINMALSVSVECRQQLQASAQHLLALFAQPILHLVAQEQGSDFAHKYSSSYRESQDTFFYDRIKSNVLLAAASSGHSQATDLLCRLYCDSRQAGAAAVDPDLLGAAYQAAVAQLEGCSTDPGLVWADMLTRWHTHPDIPESERGLCALPWTADPLLLYQALDGSYMTDKVLGRSPGSSLGRLVGAMLRSMGRKPGSGGTHWLILPGTGCSTTLQGAMPPSRAVYTNV